MFLLLGALAGFHRGVIKSLVQLIGTMCIAIIAYELKGFVANFLIEHLPFFDFGGILYCILNILITLSGVIEKLLKMTIVLAIPSKILGLIVGAIEGLAFAFLVLFILFHIPATTNYVKDSTSGIILLERMPFMSTVMNKTTLALDEIVDMANDFKDNENRKELNIRVLSTLIHYNIISVEDVEKLGEDGKIDIENVTFS